MNRVEYDDEGMLDEVVTDAGMHLERMSGKGWFLTGQRSDETEIAIWFEGKVILVEERPAKPQETPRQMYDHHATHVISWITHLALKAFKAGNEAEGSRLSKIVDDLEVLFPEAAAEIAALSTTEDGRD